MRTLPKSNACDNIYSMNKDQNMKELGSKGGKRNVALYGKKHMKALAKKANKVRWDRYRLLTKLKANGMLY